MEESDQRDSCHLEENEPEDRVNEHEGQGSEDGMCWSIYHLCPWSAQDLHRCTACLRGLEAFATLMRHIELYKPAVASIPVSLTVPIHLCHASDMQQ